MQSNIVFIILTQAIALSSCALGDITPSVATPSITISPAPSNTPSPTKTPTETVIPTITLTPTITPTSTTTPIAGGAGLVIGSCQSVGSRIYALDLAADEYMTVHDLTQTPELWETDAILQLSPTRDRIIWSYSQFRNVETGWQYGEETILEFSSKSSQYYISSIDFSEGKIAYDGEIPDLWMPVDVGLFVEEDLSEEYRSNLGFSLHPIVMHIGDLEGINKQLLATYKNASWESGAYSPNGKYYVFVAFRDDPDDDFWDLAYIAIVDLETRSLKEYPFYVFGDIRWAPDSSRFVFSGRIRDEEKQQYWGGLFLFDLKEAQAHLLREKSFAEWSPDGEWLAGYDYSEAKTAFLIRPDGSDFQPIDLPRSSTRWGVDELWWLPNGAGLYIISTARHGPEVRHLLFYDFATEGATVVQEFPDWGFVGMRRINPSPDGKWIILNSFSQDTRFTHVKAITRFWHVCSINNCVQFSPPRTSRCYNVEWVGPYALQDLGDPFVR